MATCDTLRACERASGAAIANLWVSPLDRVPSAAPRPGQPPGTARPAARRCSANSRRSHRYDRHRYTSRRSPARLDGSCLRAKPPCEAAAPARGAAASPAGATRAEVEARAVAE
eukprot:2465855-Prymnesium_polylepis.1